MGIAKKLGYMGTVEETYVVSHPEVQRLTNYFYSSMQKKKIFEKFHEQLPRNFRTATSIANAWYAFSNFMPQFLCLAATTVSDNLARHYIIQAAYEELGMRDHNQIHPTLFWNAVKSIGIHNEDMILSHGGVNESLNYLTTNLRSFSCDMQVFGILTGLEIPAIENIQTIFNAMAYDENAEKTLNNDMFFTLHREVEAEHIRLTISNFSRFNSSKTDIFDFEQGFDIGVFFWEMFWSGIKNYIDNHKR